MALWSEASKGRYSRAQGNALGIEMWRFLRPEGATPACCSAPSGLWLHYGGFPGLRPGLSNVRPFGAPSHRWLPTENSEEPRLPMPRDGGFMDGLRLASRGCGYRRAPQ